jgi:hypothetical protein
MLDCPPWTLTHSSVGAAELAPVLPLGLEVMKASRDATVLAAEAEDREDDGEPGADEPVCAAEPVVPDDDDFAGVELLAALVLAAAAVEDPPVEGEPVGDEVVGVGVAEGDGEGEGAVDGEGEGEGDADGDGDADGEDGSAWHAEFAAAAACALPTTPAVRKPPLSRVTAATRAYPKRIRIACLRLSSGLPCAVRQFGGCGRPDGSFVLISANRLHMHRASPKRHLRFAPAVEAGREPEAGSCRSDGLRP